MMCSINIFDYLNFKYIMLIRDSYTHIFTYLNYGSAYKTVITVCKEWGKIIADLYPCADTDFSNHLLTLMKLFPEYGWDECLLLSNPSMNWEYIFAMPEYPDKWENICRNPSITWENILTIPNYEKYWEQFGANRTIPKDILMQKASIVGIYSPLMRAISKNPVILWTDIVNNDYDWCTISVSANPNITW